MTYKTLLGEEANEKPVEVISASNNYTDPAEAFRRRQLQVIREGISYFRRSDALNWLGCHSRCLVIAGRSEPSPEGMDFALRKYRRARDKALKLGMYESVAHSDIEVIESLSGMLGGDQ